MQQPNATHHGALSLPITQWPKPWPQRWETTFIDEMGDFSHIGRTYKYELRWTLGVFLGFLQTQGHRIICRYHVDQSTNLYYDFVKFLLDRGNSLSAIFKYITNLEVALFYITSRRSDKFYKFKCRLHKRVISDKRSNIDPSKKEVRFEPLEKILKLGMDLYASAVDLVAGKSGEDLARAMTEARMRARDGLIFIMFCHCPLRLGDMVRISVPRQLSDVADIIIKEHIVMFPDRWELQIRAEKNEAFLIFPFPDSLRFLIAEYIAFFRPAFPGAAKCDRLFLPQAICPLERRGSETSKRAPPALADEAFGYSKDGLSAMFRRRTGEEFENALYPHFIRTACIEFWERVFPDAVREVYKVLGHSDFDITECFYRIRFKTDRGDQLVHSQFQSWSLQRTRLLIETA